VPTIFASPQKRGQKDRHFSPGIQPPTVMNPLTAFAVNPAHLRFETQEETEKVILFLRQHFIVNLPWILVTIVLVIAPTVIFPILIRALSLNMAFPVSYYVVGTMFWYLATFGFALSSFIGWFFNIYIVTNERIVDIDFFYLLYKKFSQAELTKIQDINYTSGGVLAAMFNFGNVVVETAGEAPNIDFELIPFPEKVVETIRELTEHEEVGSV
jgi:uncharacterized membrane protein YdbT with pleckstrin-like domain